MNIGDKYTTNNCGELEVIEYINATNVTVKFIQTDAIREGIQAASIRKGEVQDYMYPAICGVGYLGVGRYTATHKGTKRRTSAYMRWSHIIKRCYKPTHEGYQYYGGKGVHVKPEWHCFQTFAEWYYTECKKLGLNPDDNNYDVDKDVYAKTSPKYYAPDVCHLMPKLENNLFSTAKTHKFTNPDGQTVTIHNLAAHCRKHSLDKSAMSKVKLGKLKSHKGWTQAKVEE